jgi:LAO/AO transport system kinase
MTRLDAARAEAGIIAGDRGVLSQSITLVESTRASDRREAIALLERVLPRTGGAVRLGLSGPPGVGKSTLIEQLGMLAIERGRRVAVLAVDPSSRATGGSILGDKTRMPRLALEPRAFVRPSPAGEQLGGVARRTREALLLVEAAGFDFVIVETVGVGQSEVEVASMVDCFLLLAQPGAGDELQGIKRGIMEVADIVAVTKADGDHLPRARTTLHDVSAALRLMRPKQAGWAPRGMLVSGVTGDGVGELYDAVLEHRDALAAAGLVALRAGQAVRAMWSQIDDALRDALRAHPEVSRLLAELEPKVRDGSISPSSAAAGVIAAFAR